jgi:membrane-associated protein
VASYGVWVYALLFLIIFVETGVVVMPFLPGDSLLFVVGALCGLGLMNLPLAMPAAGRRHPGQPDQLHDRPLLRAQGVFQWEQSRWFNRAPSTRHACLLREVRRHHHRPGALHALPAHLRALRGRRGRR